MSLTHTDWNPNKKKLRSFCFVFAIFCTLVAILYAYKNTDSNFRFISGKNSAIAIAIWAPAAFALIISCTQPILIKPIYLLLTAITTPIGIIVNMILLCIIYFVFITPLAIFFKLFRRDALNKTPTQNSSYWEDLPKNSTKESYFKQF